jgi:protein OS-9
MPSYAWRTLLSLLLFVPPFALAGLFHSLPEDLHAFPKYTVTFLNGLPLLNETAERWLREGLRGEAEFLDHPTPWQEPSPFKHIDAGEGTAVRVPSSSIILAQTVTLTPKQGRRRRICPGLCHRADENGAS